MLAIITSREVISAGVRTSFQNEGKRNSEKYYDAIKFEMSLIKGNTISLRQLC